MNLGESIEKPRLLQIAEILGKHGVEFMVIGGAAAVLWGSPLPTFDVDLCYRRTPENLRRLADALRELHPALRGAPPGLPFRLDAESLALGSNFTFITDLGPIDLLGWVEPFGEYERLLPNAEEMDLGSIRVLVIGLEDLIRIKSYLGRPKDRAVLEQLLAIRRLREERSGS